MAARIVAASVACFFASCLLAGCHDDASEISHSVTGDASGVTVGNVTSRAAAAPLAEAECSVFNKAAEFKSLHQSTAVYTCVKRHDDRPLSASAENP